MPRYEVNGAYNGVAIKPTTVTAETIDDARAKASSKGVRVKSVIPLDSSAELAWHEGDASPPPLPPTVPVHPTQQPASGPGSEKDPVIAFYNRLLAMESELKRVNSTLNNIFIFVVILSLPILLGFAWFMLMFVGAIGAGAAFLRG